LRDLTRATDKFLLPGIRGVAHGMLPGALAIESLG
jgi:hypothetical protein